MKKRLYLLLALSSCIALLLFGVLHRLDQTLQHRLTQIDHQHQQQLQGYADQAEKLYAAQDQAGAEIFFSQLQQRYDTWAAIIPHERTSTQGAPALGTQVPQDQLTQLNFQRKLDWPVHSQWEQVIIGIPFQNHTASLVIRLPSSMHPKPNLELIHIGVTLVLPMLIMLAFIHWLYQHLMRPVHILQHASLALAEGQLNQAVKPQLGKREDELAQLAGTFDQMAERINDLMTSQRQIIGDLSHELRTPLSRMSLALESKNLSIKEQKQRIEREIALTNQLVEETMTLAWLDSEHSQTLNPQQQESVQLSLLLDLICDDAEFEFPKLSIKRQYPDNIMLANSHTLALSQAIENIIRNGLMHSPEHGTLYISLAYVKQPEQIKDSEHMEKLLQIRVLDQGPGVPEDKLEQIFQPFYRLDKARMRKKGGFGLGLALARKQTQRLGGSLTARNNPKGGLEMILQLPEFRTY